MEELPLDDLDAVYGGRSIGVYGSIGATGPASTGSVTIAIGVQSDFPYVTGGVYGTTGNGFSTGVSVGASAGGFASSGNADDVFTGTSTAGSLGVDAIGKVGVEGSFNGNGVTAGVGVGVGIGIDGVQASGMQTNTTSLLGDGGTGVDHSSPTIDQPTYDAMGNVTGTESVTNPNYDGGHATDGVDHSTDGTQATGGTDGVDHSTDGVDHSTDGVDHSTDSTQTAGADHTNDGGTAGTGDGVDHSNDQQQGGFDNNNGEGGGDYGGGGGGGSDYA